MATANKYNVGPLLVVTPQSNIWCCSVRLPAKACRKHVNQKKTPAKQKNNKNYKGEEDSEDQRRIKKQEGHELTSGYGAGEGVLCVRK